MVYIIIITPIVIYWKATTKKLLRAVNLVANRTHICSIMVGGIPYKGPSDPCKAGGGSEILH